MNEIARILALPRRAFLNQQAIADEITRQFRTVSGTQTLRPTQGLALYELATAGGLLAGIRVGGGKTLISLLAPRIFDSRRTVLILPASLIGKTERDKEVYRKHWQIAENIRIISYEMLGRAQAANWLENFQPDLIIADECHRLKNLRAAVTKRVARYFAAHPDTKFIGLSGTIVRKSIKDYAHLIAWALKGGSPLPLDKDQVEQWAEVLDDQEGFSGSFAVKPRIGSLACFGGSVSQIRDGFRKRLTETPGVIISAEGEGCTASLLLRAVDYKVEDQLRTLDIGDGKGPQTKTDYQRLRQDWFTPDGWPLADPIEVWRHARELALGLHYVWDPRPPRDWIQARREYFARCRQIIIRSRQYDSEKQVSDAIEAKSLDCPEYWRWRDIKDTFEIHSVPVWHSDFGLNTCQAWAAQSGGGIIWTTHSFFGHELAKRANLQYFGAGGLSSDGKPIEETSPERDGTIVASVTANREGRNLQRWSRGLITTLPSSGLWVEQLLGRKHRDGQLADEVTFDFLMGCKEHLKAYQDAFKDAQMIFATTGQAQKLLYCDTDIDIKPNAEWRWGDEMQFS